MPASSSDGNHPRLHGDEAGVSEVVGFLLTFGIISTILLVAMLGFNDAQQRAEVRLIEIQGSSAAQRVASAAVDLALFAQSNPHETAVAIDLPAELQGISYSVFLCMDTDPASDDPSTNSCGDEDAEGDDLCATFACPYVKVESFRGDPQRQSTFLLAGMEFCAPPYNAASGGIALVKYFPPGGVEPEDCIGLIDETT